MSLSGIDNPAADFATGVRQLPHAHGEPLGPAAIRTSPDDFIVREALPWQPDGDGEHLLLLLKKRDYTTSFAVRQLAEACDVATRHWSWSGLKDRHAETTQWLCLPWPVKSALPDWSELPEGLAVLAQYRQGRKLRSGSHRYNRFRLVLRGIDAEQSAVENRLADIRRDGFPNYFGEQRFGHAGQTWSDAAQWLKGEGLRPRRHQRSLWLSAIRSGLFNAVLAERVRSGSWLTAVEGDCLQIADSGSFFAANSKAEQSNQPTEASLSERLRDGALSVSGPLAGQAARVTATDAAAELENLSMRGNEDLLEALSAQRVNEGRRPLRVKPLNLQHRWLAEGGNEGGQQALELSFRLPRGSYATALMRELFATKAPEPQNVATQTRQLIRSRD